MMTTVCAWCFGPASETVAVDVSGDRYELDLCPRHLEELLIDAEAKPHVR